jgi:hypothetical protein
MDEKMDELRAQFDAFSRRLDSSIQQFNTTGELAGKREAAERLRKRHEATKKELDLAVSSGPVADVFRLELKRDFEGLMREFARLEMGFDAASMRDGRTSERSA